MGEFEAERSHILIGIDLFLLFVHVSSARRDVLLLTELHDECLNSVLSSLHFWSMTETSVRIDAQHASKYQSKTTGVSATVFSTYGTWNHSLYTWKQMLVQALFQDSRAKERPHSLHVGVENR